VLRETHNCIESSEYDLKTAEHMFSTDRYLYVVFMCHLAIEKLLKAIMHESTGSLPPKSHDLIYLLKLVDMRPPQDLLEFMGKINSASVVTRYPEDLSRILAAYPATVAEEHLSKTREVLQWLRQDKRLLQS
jgi:HEPN domain-containing protein